MAPTDDRSARRAGTPRSRAGLPASLALLTDLYQLTMAYGYGRSSRAEAEAAFHMSFRSSPFAGGFAIACGLELVIDYLQNMRFTPEDTAWLSEQRGNDGGRLFDDAQLPADGEVLEIAGREIGDVDEGTRGAQAFGEESGFAGRRG